MRIFLDTNVLAGALSARWLCAELMEMVLAEHDLVSGEPVMIELRRSLEDTLKLPDALIQASIEFLSSVCVFGTQEAFLEASIPDARQLPKLACALGGRADCFVTGNEPLLALGKVGEMPIVSAREQWIRLRGA